MGERKGRGEKIWDKKMLQRMKLETIVSLNIPLLSLFDGSQFFLTNFFHPLFFVHFFYDSSFCLQRDGRREMRENEKKEREREGRKIFSYPVTCDLWHTKLRLIEEEEEEKYAEDKYKERARERIHLRPLVSGKETKVPKGTKRKHLEERKERRKE